MKKKLFALLLATILIVSLLLSLTACGGNRGYSEKYRYSGCYVNRTISSEYSTFDETLEFIYSDTFLKLYDNGKWVIDTSGLFSTNIDQGTYELNGNEYIFHGFEYGMKTIGYKSGNTFAFIIYGINTTTVYIVVLLISNPIINSLIIFLWVKINLNIPTKVIR